MGVVAHSGRVYVAGTECVPGSASECAVMASGGRVQVLQGGANTVVTNVLLPAVQSGPFGVAVDQARQRIYVTCKGNGGWLNVIQDGGNPG